MKNKTLESSQKLLQALASTVGQLQSDEEVLRFLMDLCTPAELQAMADRWQVAQMLEAGRTYRDIQSETGVSVTTVGRVARAMTFGDSGYQLALQKIKRSNNGND